MSTPAAQAFRSGGISPLRGDHACSRLRTAASCPMTPIFCRQPLTARQLVALNVAQHCRTGGPLPERRRRTPAAGLLSSLCSLEVNRISRNRAMAERSAGPRLQVRMIPMLPRGCSPMRLPRSKNRPWSSPGPQRPPGPGAHRCIRHRRTARSRRPQAQRRIRGCTAGSGQPALCPARPVPGHGDPRHLALSRRSHRSAAVGAGRPASCHSVRLACMCWWPARDPEEPGRVRAPAASADGHPVHPECPRTNWLPAWCSLSQIVDRYPACRPDVCDTRPMEPGKGPRRRLSSPTGRRPASG